MNESFNDLFMPKSKNKREFSQIENEQQQQPFKKRKIIKSETTESTSTSSSYEEKMNIDNDVKLLVSKSKVTKFAIPNNLSWHDPKDSSVQNEEESDSTIKYPNSMKYERNKIIVPREYHNSQILDTTNKNWGNTKSNELNNKTHILEIIPSGFQDVLSTETTLRLAIEGLGTDSFLIKEENEKKKLSLNNTLTTTSSSTLIKKPLSNKKKSNKKDNAVINKIEIIGKEGVSLNYNFGRLSKQMIGGTLKHFSKLTSELITKFFQDDYFPISKEINCDLYKSELFKKLSESYEKQYQNSSKKNEDVASYELKYDLPYLPKLYIQSFRYPPRGIEYGERECISGKSCIFNNFKSFASNQYLHYIGKEFLLPKDLEIYNKTKKLPEIIGPCIDCLLYEWTSYVYLKVMQFNIIPEKPINTFRVKVEENEYSSTACISQRFRDGKATGIHGFCPCYSEHLRTYSKEKRIDLKNGDIEKEFYYLAEINTDFRLPLVKQTIV